MPIRVPKRRGPPSANYLPLLMMFMLMLSPNTLLTPIIPPPCTPMPESDIYPAALALHQCSLTRKYRRLRSHLVFYFILFYFGGGRGGGSRRFFRWQDGGGHSGHRFAFELQINQGPLSLSSSFHSVQGHPDYTRLKCVFECVCMQKRPGVEVREGGWAAGLSLVGLAYNSYRARELKAAQRYDGQAKWSPALCFI